MHVLQIDFNGDPNIGLFGFATDSYCFAKNAKGVKNVKKVLKVPVFSSTIFNTDLVGIFAAGNSHGIVVSDVIYESEMEKIKKHVDDVLVLKTRFTAVGNLILMNDKGIILSPMLKKHKRKIESFFGLKCKVSRIAGLDIVGSLGVTTNKGCLVNPNIRPSEKKTIEKVLGVKADIGTVSFGSMFPKSGIIANSNGFAVSKMSSGPEVQRMDETFGFV
jgi:translation initiation factor 6